jgi:hypothetical protein
VDALTRFYLFYRWTYNHARVPFDEARKLATGAGVELTALGAGGLVQKQKDYVVVLSPQERAKTRSLRVRNGSRDDGRRAASGGGVVGEKSDEGVGGAFGGDLRRQRGVLAGGAGHQRGVARRRQGETTLQGLLYGRKSYGSERKLL